MNDEKEISIFLLRILQVLLLILMFMYSKTGTYLIILFGVSGITYYKHTYYPSSLLDQLTLTFVIVTVFFELFHPIVFRKFITDMPSVKKEYKEVKDELKRRKSSKNVNNKA